MTTDVSVMTDGTTRVFGRKARIKVRNLGGEIVIEANAAGLKTLAGHLLTLARTAPLMVLISTWRRTTDSKRAP
jgi:ABC-type protease/lipase transport system fused ATPase/permease subunit